ncbi:aminotransferase class V-fold PLP-dependent enzyme [Fusobacterium ulcerans]|uniref:cysteine desulfurase n=2 Tax=Fusobacterium ulcerans TaxID=861 RepID=A0AAX2J992_9FUSO|nr:aminotransferase class V-fold PLP-dependent enzyme [Fusobacterium ulcerans]AVQ29661.1 aminotransferase class V-fold PLP-dependent enzyme [Fusobacterium ulcerans]EFS26162.1 cysteine desulfurase [Fusobacterium ulcerans ATCC 49185]SQJ00579.1 Probable cysteine desulfurase [Fusobacterium ulcerans]
MITIDKKIYYFDNSATSFPKPESVYKCVEKAVRLYGANPGRGGHRMAVEASQAIYETREKVASLFNIKNPLQIAFTYNSTYALNFAVKGAVPKDSHIITTSLEHNSVLRPVFYEKDENNAHVSIIEPSEDGNIHSEDIIAAMKPETKAVVLTHMSNVTGAIIDLLPITTEARKRNILTIVDVSQSAGFLDIDVEEMKIDILCFTGHKSLFGIQGTGGIYIREGIPFSPIIEGGTGSFSKMKRQPHSMPEALEAGTLNTPGIVSLGAGIDFINSIGLENIRKHEYSLTEKFIEGIKNIEEIIIYGPEKRGPVVTLNIKGVDSGDLAAYLDEEYSILTRAGIHCAPLAHESMHSGENGGVRFSFGYFNTEEDITYAINTLKNIVSDFKNI